MSVKGLETFVVLQLIGNRLVEVPVPEVAAGSVLIRVEMALIWMPGAPSAGPIRRWQTLWARYPNAARKWLDYARHEGTRATWNKTRARLDTMRINDTGGVASVMGRVETVGAGVEEFAPGDTVAGFGFARPGFAEFLLLPAAWCSSAAGVEPRRAAALLPGLIALHIAQTRPTSDHLSDVFARVLAGRTIEPLTALLPDPNRHELSLYSEHGMYVPNWAQTAYQTEYFKQAETGLFDPCWIALPSVDMSRAGQRLTKAPVFLIGQPGRVRRTETTAVPVASDGFGISVIGAGDYMRSVLLPELIGMPRLDRRGVVDLNPAAAALTASRFGFGFATTRADAVFDDPALRGLIVASYHDTHAPLAIRALEKGIAGFVEKPPVTSWAQLHALIAAYERRPGFIAFGYNRRFAPAIAHLQRLLASEPGPLTMVCLVRGHSLPPTHWYHGAFQGSQIAGNLCHWIDLCYLLTRPASPISVTTSAPPTATPASAVLAENVSVTLTFADGSLAVIVFTNRGDALRGVQEWIEVRRGDLSVSVGSGLDRLHATRAGRTVERWHGARDKGHAAEIRAVLRAMQRGDSPPVPFREAALSSVLMLCAVDSLVTGQPIQPDSALMARCQALPE